MKNKKVLRTVAIVGAVALLLGSSLAYFTDRASTTATGKAGTVAISLDSDVNLKDADGKDILNPGDQRDASFGITNEGNKSIDVRETIVLRAFDKDGNPKALVADANGQHEYELYKADDVELVEGRGYQPKAGKTPLAVADATQAAQGILTYKPADYVLNGNEDFGDENREIETGVNTDSHDGAYVLVMRGSSDNSWQASKVQLDVLAEAKQHRNTSAGWSVVSQETYGFAGNDQNQAVPMESVITNAAGAVNGAQSSPQEP